MPSMSRLRHFRLTMPKFLFKQEDKQTEKKMEVDPELHPPRFLEVRV